MYLPTEDISRWLFSASVHVLANREYQQIAVWCFSACTCQQRISTDCCFNACTCQQRITTNGCSVHVLKLPVNREDQQMTVWWFSTCTCQQNINKWLILVLHVTSTDGSFWCFSVCTYQQRISAGGRFSALVHTCTYYLPTEGVNMWLFSTVYLPTENINKWLPSTCTCQHRITTGSCWVPILANRE